MAHAGNDVPVDAHLLHRVHGQEVLLGDGLATGPNGEHARLGAH